MLKEVSAVTYLKDFTTKGHSPILILADDNKKYVVKPSNGKNEIDYSIYNEILCNYLLNEWKIESPEIALVNVKREIISNSPNGNNYKKGVFNQRFFGSVFIENSIELTQFLSFNKKVDFKKMKSPEKLIDLALFDLWIENDDRKPTNYNIILDPDGDRFKFIPIDNAFTLNSLNYKALNPEFLVTNSLNDNILYGEIGAVLKKKFKPNKKWIEHKKDLFYLCISKSEAKFDEIIDNISPFYTLNKEDYNGLKNFLFNIDRNKQVFLEFINRLSK